MNKHILISEVVDQRICIGCGVCSGICPGKNIEMRWSEMGELNPYIDKGCPPEICVCIHACPILNPLYLNNDINTDAERKENDIIGDYISCYSGFSLQEKQRSNGSSGGVLTWLLTALLEDKKIDGAIVVVEGSNPKDRLFEFKILETKEEIEAASGSKYYPVEVSDVMRFLKKDKSNKHYALVGLPCLITGIAQAKQFNKRLTEKILYTFSLTCGQLPNKFYTQALASYSGISPNNLASANYRSKDGTQNARNYIFSAKNFQGDKGKAIYWNTKPWYLWKNSFFIHGACKICDDVFGKNSDIVFMDAWLDRYSDDPKGHSFITVKNRGLELFLQRKIETSEVYLLPENIKNILLSQQGIIKKKTKTLSANLYKLQQEGVRITKRSIQPNKLNYSETKDRLDLEWNIMQESKIKWARLQREEQEHTFFNSLNNIDAKIQIIDRKEKIHAMIQKFKTSPINTIKNVILFQIKKLYRKKI